MNTKRTMTNTSLKSIRGTAAYKAVESCAVDGLAACAMHDVRVIYHRSTDGKSPDIATCKSKSEEQDIKVAVPTKEYMDKIKSEVHLQKNAPDHQGQAASRRIFFRDSLVLFAVHTTVDDVEWIVIDSERADHDGRQKIVTSGSLLEVLEDLRTLPVIP